MIYFTARFRSFERTEAARSIAEDAYKQVVLNTRSRNRKRNEEG